MTNPKNTTEQKAVKYNRLQLDEQKTNSVTNYDYLVLNYSSIPTFENTKYLSFKHLDYGTKQFKNITDIYLNEIKFCTLTYNPRNSVLNKHLIQVKINNPFLYVISLKDLKNNINYVEKVLNLRNVSISRIDVCKDYENTTNYFSGLISQIFNNEVLISGRPKKRGYYNTVINFHNINEGSKVINCGFSLGRKSSPRYLRIYNKSLEQQEQNYKSYIVDSWKNSGFTDTSNVWRLEYSLNSVFIKKHQIKFEDLFNPSFVNQILLNAYDNHFVIRENTGKSETNKEKQIHNFDFTEVKHKDCKIIQKLPQLKDKIQFKVISIKRSIKQFFRHYYNTKNTFYYDAYKDLINRFDLHEWFVQKELFYLSEFQKLSITYV